MSRPPRGVGLTVLSLLFKIGGAVVHQQPLKEMNSPSGKGSVGLKGVKG